MRNKLIKLLRCLENESGYENKYADQIGEHQCDYEVQEYINFPNYRLIIRRYNEMYPLPKYHGQQPMTPSNGINAELKRMEMDGLLMTGTQSAVKNAYTGSKCGPDYDDVVFTSESVVLTTKGKSGWRYILYKANENPITLTFTLTAVTISIIGLFL